MSIAPIPTRPEGRVPPHDLEAETSVLGAILLDQAAITRVLDVLSPEDFYRENNGQIYRAAQNLFREGEPVDNITLASELEKLGVLERVGGRAHLALLQESVPTAANVEHYARIVKDKAYKRRLITAGGQVTALGYDESMDAEEAVNQAQSHVYAVSDDRVGSGMERLYDLLKPAMDRIDAQMATGGGVIGIPSGFHDLDRMTNGFKPSDLVVIAGRPSMGKCLSSTMLLDDPASGERLTIAEAVRRRLPVVLGISEMGTVRPAAVAAWVDSGVKPCYRVRTATGRTVEVTQHHPFLTVVGWQPLHDIAVGDRIAVPRAVPCFGHDDSLGAEDLRALARRVVDHGGGRFPARVWRLDRLRLAWFLRGVLAACGAVATAGARPCVRIPVPSPELARDLQHALTRFAVISLLRPGEDALEVRDAPSVAVLRRRVGIAGEAPPGRDLFASTVPWQPTVPAQGPGRPAAAARRAAPGIGVRVDPHVARLASPDLYWDEVVSIEPIGRHQVYDLTVPDGSNFIAQDVVVHNTSFMLNVALNAAVEHQRPVAIFSLEMSKEQLVERMLCEQARIDAQRMHRGTLSEVEYDRLARALGPLGEAPIFIDDAPMLDDLTMRLKARQARSREGIEMIMLDYLQLMHGRTKGDDNRVQEVSAISRALKSIARELRIPVIAASQLSRAPEARPDKRPILSDLRESGCLTADTRLLRADTGVPVSIGELLERGCDGVSVWAVDERRRLRPAPLLRVFASGVKPVFRLRLASGREVKASGNHRFLTYGGWRALEELTAGDRLAVPRHIPSPTRTTPWSAPRLALLAHLIGDGCTLPKQPIHYTSSDEESLRLVEDAARSEFGIIPRRVEHGTWWHSYLPAPYRLGRGKRNPIAAWLIELGVFGLRSHEKRIPEAVFAASDDDVALFLRHLWATDGCVADGRIPGLYYGTSSRRLAEDVSLLLGRLGLLTKTTSPLKRGAARPGYQVWIRGVDQIRAFARRVGIHGPRGRQLASLVVRLERLRANTNIDTVPLVVWRDVRREMVGAGITGRALADGIGMAYCGTTLFKSAPSRERLARVVAALGGSALLEGCATDDVFWDRVVAIEPLGEQPVYDGTVGGLHNFVADGIIAHNSIEQDADIVMFLYRDEYYLREKSEKPGIAEILVAKHRNGPTGMVELRFRKELTRFENLERRRPEIDVGIGPEP